MRNVLYILAIIIGLSFSQTVHAATLTVPAGGDLQSAINAAQPGDTIIVQAGTIYTGPFSLPLKSGDAYISIQSSRLSELPADTRVNPSQSALFAKLQSASPAEPVLKTAAGAHHYRFLGIEFSTANAGVLVYDLIRLGEGRELQTGLDSVPHHLTLDRCYIHGFDTQDVQRGIALNSAETTISNSYISEIHGIGFDTQAICGWNGPGPFHIINNYLEGAGENVLFGGADPGIFGLVPSDIEIRGNLVFKPLTWKVGDPSYLGRHWTIKNLLELKNARRVIIDGNIFQNNWPDAQIGIPILFTARNQDGTAPWSVVEFVSFTNNTVRNAEGGVHILRTDAESRGAITSDITISNNVFDEIKGNGFLVLINNPNNITAVHNTVFKNRNIVTIDARTIDPQGTGLIIKDNLFSEGDYGVHGSGVGEGTIALSTFFAGYVFERNNLAGRDVSLYAFGNTFFGTDQVGFTDYLNRNYKLTITSPLKGKATDGKDVGADIDVLNAAQSGASAPVPSPSPSPSPTPLPSPSPTPTPLPSPSPSPTPTPAPSPSPTPAPTPAPSPSPSPTPAPTPRCIKVNPKGKCLKWQ